MVSTCGDNTRDSRRVCIGYSFSPSPPKRWSWFTIYCLIFGSSYTDCRSFSSLLTAALVCWWHWLPPVCCFIAVQLWWIVGTVCSSFTSVKWWWGCFFFARRDGCSHATLHLTFNYYSKIRLCMWHFHGRCHSPPGAIFKPDIQAFGKNPPRGKPRKDVGWSSTQELLPPRYGLPFLPRKIRYYRYSSSTPQLFPTGTKLLGWEGIWVDAHVYFKDLHQDVFQWAYTVCN